MLVAHGEDDRVPLGGEALADRRLELRPVRERSIGRQQEQLLEVETLVAEMQDLGVLYDRDEKGSFMHFYTRTIGSVFFEVVQRTGGYDGYGAANAAVRLAAQHEAGDNT